MKSVNLLPEHGEVYLINDFLNTDEVVYYMESLLHTIKWHQDEIKLFGKVHLAPRLTAWYGDEGLSYGYSGVRLQAITWTNELKTLKEAVEKACMHSFNSVLLNYYRNGQDSMGWHADDEAELGPNPVIASLSLGQERVIHFRLKSDPKQKVKVSLPSGSLLVMQGETQHFWQHHIPKSKRVMAGRINLTFRRIIKK